MGVLKNQKIEIFVEIQKINRALNSFRISLLGGLFIRCNLALVAYICEKIVLNKICWFFSIIVLPGGNQPASISFASLSSSHLIYLPEDKAPLQRGRRHRHLPHLQLLRLLLAHSGCLVGRSVPWKVQVMHSYP